MGQAWCKERTSKAQDSKSPLDRVFVRCAHRIYPGLKEEGSVLGGATQRVTSSEIGYAGSPPREFLARGRSIDSVDRPFHPSDWVDVNLEVPTTPDANIPRRPSVQVAVANPRHAASAASPVCAKKKDAAPVPPPRKGRRNRGRPLPPKPDELLEKTSSDSKHVDASDEPFYSSVNSTKAALDDYATMDDVAVETRKKTVEAVRRSKDVFEHKVNGTGKVITSDVVSGKRSSHGERKSAKAANSHQQHANQIAKIEEEAAKSSHEDSSCKCDRQDRDKLEVNARPKNYSTVSLPNYDELDVARHAIEELQEKEEDEKKAEERGKARPKRPARISTGSLPVESFLLPFSQKTSVRLEDYIPRRDSTEDLSEHQLLAKLASNGNAVAQGEFFKYDSNKLADWQVLADRDGNCESNDRNVPQESSRGNSGSAGVDVCDSSGYATIEETKATISPRASRDLEKPEFFGKAFDCGGTQSDCDEACEDSKSMRGKKVAKCLESPTAVEIRKPAAPPSCNDPFFLCAKEEKRVAVKLELSEREEWRETKEQQQQHPLALSSSQLDRSSATFTRSLSNESEPCELFAYESKELPLRGGNEKKEMTKAISEESLPREMLDEVVMDVAPSQDFRHSLEDEEQQEKAIAKTPPPSPESKEPKTKVEFLENEHSTLLKILKEEATEGSNLSSMTPSLTELEVALSDMLEKEEEDEEKGDSSSRRSTNSRVVSFESSTPYSKGRKVSLCPWEEKRMILGDVDFHDECSRILPEEETRKKESSLLLPRESLGKEANAFQEVCERSPSPPCGISAPPRRKHRSKEGSDLFSSSSDRLI